MLGMQADELRSKAKLLRSHADGLTAPLVIPSTKELMALTMLDSASRMEEAADTIESMRDRLCELRRVGCDSRYHALFGTPERAARTLARNSGEHAVCNLPTWATSSCDYDAWLRWLRGDAE